MGGKDEKPPFAGRIYQNPQNKCEVWINCGCYGYDYEWNDADIQIYPEYDDKLQECGVSADMYDHLINFTQQQISTTGKPCMSSGGALLLCCCTCGVLFCPLCNLKSDFQERERALIGAFNDYDRDHFQGITISLRFQNEEFCQRATSNPWVDSTGQPINESPPPGMNIVLKFSQPIPCIWPDPIAASDSVVDTASVAGPYPPPMQYRENPPQNPPYPALPPQQISMYPPQQPPPQYSAEPQPLQPQIVYVAPGSVPLPPLAEQTISPGKNFCQNCGTKIEGTPNFCGECGAKL